MQGLVLLDADEANVGTEMPSKSWISVGIGNVCCIETDVSKIP